MTPQHPRPASNQAPRLFDSFRTVGIVFTVLGALAIVLPALATLVIAQLIGWLMLAWGVAGVLLARSFRRFAEWKLVAAGFVLLALAGLYFLLVPGVGASVMTVFVVAGFLIEGILSILLGLRMSGQMGNWQWIVLSGVCAFILGLVVLLQWPTASQWVLGFMVGINFLSTGISLLFVSRAMRQQF